MVVGEVMSSGKTVTTADDDDVVMLLGSGSRHTGSGCAAQCRAYELQDGISHVRPGWG